MKKMLRHNADGIRMYAQSQGQKNVPWLEMISKESQGNSISPTDSFITWSNIKMFALEAMKDSESAGQDFRVWLQGNCASITKILGQSWLDRKLSLACQSIDPLSLSLTLTSISSVADAEIKQAVKEPKKVMSMH